MGVIHAYDLTVAGVQNKFGWFAAPQFVLGYGMTALVLIGLHWRNRAAERAREMTGPEQRFDTAIE